MINKIAANLTLSPQERQKAASSNDIDWKRYMNDLNDLKTNPPKKYAVTISEFQMGGMRFPTWQIPDFTNSGFTSIPPAYDRRIVVTEKHLKLLQKEVSGYLRDIVELDPLTEQPLTSTKSASASGTSHQTSLLTSLHSADSVATTKNASLSQIIQSQTTTAANSPKPTTAKVAQLYKKEEQQILPEAQAFDFTKLTPEAQQSTIRLAEQLLTAALRQLGAPEHSTGDINALNRTA